MNKKIFGVIKKVVNGFSFCCFIFNFLYFVYFFSVFIVVIPLFPQKIDHREMLPPFFISILYTREGSFLERYKRGRTKKNVRKKGPYQKMFYQIVLSQYSFS